jgi:hypothetical protein
MLLFPIIPSIIASPSSLPKDKTGAKEFRKAASEAEEKKGPSSTIEIVVVAVVVDASHINE